MATISSYDNDSTINPLDKLIGSDGSIGVDNGKTKNYTVSALREYFLESVVPGSTVISEGDLRSVSITLSPQQVLSLNGGGSIELLPAPDSGKAYYVTESYFHLDFNTTSYDLAGSVAIYYYDPEIGSSSAAYSGANVNLSNINGSSSITVVSGDVTGTLTLSPLGIYLVAPDSVSVSQGDSIIKIRLAYKIVDLSL
jgi:hypothetical protein